MEIKEDIVKINEMLDKHDGSLRKALDAIECQRIAIRNNDATEDNNGC